MPRRIPDRRRNFRWAAGLPVLLLAWLALVFPGDCSALKPDEELMFYPALARQVKGGWELEVHGLVYEPERRRMMTGLLERLLGLSEKDLTTAEAALFRERISYFLVDDERDKQVTVRLGTRRWRLGSSGANGHFTARWVWRTNDALIAAWFHGATNGRVTLELPLERAQDRTRPMNIHLVANTGISVLSDIDDTIKISQVRDRDALLMNTLCRPFRPVSGMAGRYRDWERTAGVDFHYVTASPWQLYVPLSEFVRSNGFPAGTFHMKDFRLKDTTALSLLGSPERYKPGVIEPLLRRFPKRTFVLVGDSGEKDPEIYGELARRYPIQVQRIFIRNVTSEDGTASRYRQAFRGLSPHLWQVFANPNELPDRLLP